MSDSLRDKFPNAKFKCLICGQIRDNQDHIRYYDVEKQKKTVAEDLANLEKYRDNTETVSYINHQIVLEGLPPDGEVYAFTICHGLFSKVEES